MGGCLSRPEPLPGAPAGARPRPGPDDNKTSFASSQSAATARLGSALPSATSHAGSESAAKEPASLGPDRPEKPRSGLSGISSAGASWTSTPQTPTGKREGQLAKLATDVHEAQMKLFRQINATGEQQRFQEEVTLGTQLGSGSSGTVYVGLFKPSNAKVAIKHVKTLLNKEMDINAIRSAREAALGASLEHPSIVKTLAHYTFASMTQDTIGAVSLTQLSVETYIVTEYCDRGTLAQLLQLPGHQPFVRMPTNGELATARTSNTARNSHQIRAQGTLAQALAARLSRLNSNQLSSNLSTPKHDSSPVVGAQNSGSNPSVAPLGPGPGKGQFRSDSVATNTILPPAAIQAVAQMMQLSGSGLLAGAAVAQQPHTAQGQQALDQHPLKPGTSDSAVSNPDLVNALLGSTFCSPKSGPSPAATLTGPYKLDLAAAASLAQECAQAATTSVTSVCSSTSISAPLPLVAVPGCGPSGSGEAHPASVAGAGPHTGPAAPQVISEVMGSAHSEPSGSAVSLTTLRRLSGSNVAARLAVMAPAEGPEEAGEAAGSGAALAPGSAASAATAGAAGSGSCAATISWAGLTVPASANVSTASWQRSVHSTGGITPPGTAGRPGTVPAGPGSKGYVRELQGQEEGQYVGSLMASASDVDLSRGRGSLESGAEARQHRLSRTHLSGKMEATAKHTDCSSSAGAQDTPSLTFPDQKLLYPHQPVGSGNLGVNHVQSNFARGMRHSIDVPRPSSKRNHPSSTPSPTTLSGAGKGAAAKDGPSTAPETTQDMAIEPAPPIDLQLGTATAEDVYKRLNTGSSSLPADRSGTSPGILSMEACGTPTAAAGGSEAVGPLSNQGRTSRVSSGTYRGAAASGLRMNSLGHGPPRALMDSKNSHAMSTLINAALAAVTQGNGSGSGSATEGGQAQAALGASPSNSGAASLPGQGQGQSQVSAGGMPNQNSLTNVSRQAIAALMAVSHSTNLRSMLSNHPLLSSAGTSNPGAINRSGQGPPTAGTGAGSNPGAVSRPGQGPPTAGTGGVSVGPGPKGLNSTLTLQQQLMSLTNNRVNSTPHTNVTGAISIGSHVSMGMHEYTVDQLVEVIDTLMELADALRYMHNLGIVHGDLKTSNVLLQTRENDRGYVAKVADFGISRMMQDSKTHITIEGMRGTPAYMAPELVDSGKMSPACDVYAFGIIMWEMITRTLPFNGLSFTEMMSAKTLGKLDDLLIFPMGLPWSYENLARACWALRPENRPTMGETHQELDRIRKELHGISVHFSLDNGSNSNLDLLHLLDDGAMLDLIHCMDMCARSRVPSSANMMSQPDACMTFKGVADSPAGMLGHVSGVQQAMSGTGSAGGQGHASAGSNLGPGSQGTQPSSQKSASQLPGLNGTSGSGAGSGPVSGANLLARNPAAITAAQALGGRIALRMASLQQQQQQGQGASRTWLSRSLAAAGEGMGSGQSVGGGGQSSGGGAATLHGSINSRNSFKVHRNPGSLVGPGGDPNSSMQLLQAAAAHMLASVQQHQNQHGPHTGPANLIGSLIKVLPSSNINSVQDVGTRSQPDATTLPAWWYNQQASPTPSGAVAGSPSALNASSDAGPHKVLRIGGQRSETVPGTVGPS